MGGTLTKLASAIGLTLCLASPFAPLGCGSSQDFAVVHSRRASDGPEAPQATVAQLTGCAEEGAGRLTDTHYTVLFDVDVDEDGRVQAARVKDSIVGDRGIESCMVDALRGMSLPASIMGMRKSGRVSAESRRHVGVAAAPALVALGPIAVVAAGITILVVVTVYVVSEAATATRDAIDEEREKARCKKVKQECITYCSDTTLPTPDVGWSFHKCKNECLERHGCPRDS
jgi:hypothetical protein